MIYMILRSGVPLSNIFMRDIGFPNNMRKGVKMMHSSAGGSIRQDTTEEDFSPSISVGTSMKSLSN